VSRAERRLRRRRTRTYEDQPYVKQQAAALRLGMIPAGAYTDVYISHDDWCDLLNKRGFCNCEPTVEFVPRSEEYLQQMLRRARGDQEAAR
jgi:hypothetical protein